MSLQVEKLEKNMAKLTIEVSAEDLDKAMEKAYQKQKSRISLPGFRKGKAPRKMIDLKEQTSSLVAHLSISDERQSVWLPETISPRYRKTPRMKRW